MFFWEGFSNSSMEKNSTSMVWDAKGVPLAKWAGWGVERDPVTFRRDWLLASLPSDMPAVGRL